MNTNRAYLRSGRARGLNDLGMRLVERIAKVVAQVVHDSMLVSVVSGRGT
jgi:hypothetical protein